MTLPGVPAEMNDPELFDRAENAAEELLEQLKEKVQAEARDIGTLRKEVTVTVPAEVIAGRLTHDFDEIRQEAVLPGFRKGRAPLALVQKRFGGDVRNSLKTSVIGQSFFASADKLSFQPLGDPLFRVDTGEGVRLCDLSEALQHIDLPDSGDMTYVCEVEVKPEFELPELKGIPIKNPKIEITDEMVSERISRQCKIRGRFDPSSEPAAEDDMVVADVRLVVDGSEVKKEENVQLGVRAARLDGVVVSNLGEVLKSVKVGDEKNAEVTLPDDYERSDLRGKAGSFEFKVREIKRLSPVTVESLVEQEGAESEEQLRKFYSDDLEAERDMMLRRARKIQVLDYLLDAVKIDVPKDLSARQTDRAVMRKVIDLQQEGVPFGEIEAQIDQLRTSASEEVARSLKLEFILEKVAEHLEVVVTDEEVNSEVARMARMYNRRFDRVRDELQARGLLTQLAEQIRQDKCVQLLLEDAKFTEDDGAK